MQIPRNTKGSRRGDETGVINRFLRFGSPVKPQISQNINNQRTDGRTSAIPVRLPPKFIINQTDAIPPHPGRNR